jgi:hypothetical protein
MRDAPTKMMSNHVGALLPFTVEILMYGFVGSLLGGAVEKVVTLIPSEPNQSIKCGGLLVLELVLNAFVIWVSTLVSGKDMFSLLSNGWQGRIFLLLFFVAQGSLSRNTQCLYNISY